MYLLLLLLFGCFQLPLWPPGAELWQDAVGGRNEFGTVPCVQPQSSSGTLSINRFDFSPLSLPGPSLGQPLPHLLWSDSFLDMRGIMLLGGYLPSLWSLLRRYVFTWRSRDLTLVSMPWPPLTPSASDSLLSCGRGRRVFGRPLLLGMVGAMHGEQASTKLSLCSSSCPVAP